MLGRIIGTVVVVLVAAGLAVLFWPQLLGLQTAPGMAQAIALRGAAAAIAFIAVILLTLLALLVRPVRGLLAGLAIVTLAFVVAHVVVIANRGALGAALPAPAPGAVTVLAWNTFGEAPSAEDVVDLIEETGADIVSLPETGYDRGAELVAELAARGIEMQQLTFAYDTIAKTNSTTLLVRTSLGPYTADTTTPTTLGPPSLVATPVDGDGPVIAAVHTTRPGASDTSRWRADLRWLAELCAEPDLIVAGDLNSTIDHWAGLGDPAVPGAEIGGCADAAAANGSGGIGTWPANVPALLGAPIDHVLTGSSWTATGFRVVQSEDGAGSDHRPVLAQLVPSAG
ncbi:MAG: hypothetical protein BGO95_08050 [Micrococcales bacterium 73-13]|nr:MAG: hypothetical protein BGO95_08050 [Micrococcales bacterium 73-13]